MSTTLQHATNQDRTTELRAAAKIFIDYHKQWQLDDTKTLPDEKYFEKLGLLLSNFSKGEISVNCLDLASAVNQLRIELQNYDTREELGERYPHAEFWAAVELIDAELNAGPTKEPSFPPIESMQLLQKQGVSEMQIARIYEFKDANGNPDVRPVMQELKEPGSVINSRWTDPRLLRWREEQASKRIIVESDLQKVYEEMNEEAEHVAATETVEDLFAQGLSASQTSKVLDIPVKDVQAEYERLQAESQKKKAGASGKDSDNEKSTSTTNTATNTASNSVTNTNAIADLHAAGKNNREIADRLKIGLSEVNKAVKELEKEPAKTS